MNAWVSVFSALFAVVFLILVALLGVVYFVSLKGTKE